MLSLEVPFKIVADNKIRLNILCELSVFQKENDLLAYVSSIDPAQSAVWLEFKLVANSMYGP